MTDFNIENFKDEYKQVLLKQKKLVSDLLSQWQNEESKLCKIQQHYGERYKKEIVRKYMRFWNKSGAFPKDDELTKVVFYLADLDTADMGLSCNKKIPQTELRLNSDMTFTFRYFNERLNAWIQLEP